MCAGESINPGNHWDMSTEMVLAVVQHSLSFCLDLKRNELHCAHECI